MVMACIAAPGHFYLDPRSRQVFEVRSVTIWIVEVIDCAVKTKKEIRLFNRSMFERDCVQVSA